MKVYSIGRETGCDIVINDSTDVISRRHAILNVTSMGKMTIVDQSHNGTYVNGIRISPNVPVPVTRKDSVSFAHVARLDWNRVPKSGTAIKYSIIGLVALAVIAVAGIGINAAFSGGSTNESSDKPAAVADTTKTQKEDDKQKTEDAKASDNDSKKSSENKADKSDKKQDKKDKKQAADDKQKKQNGAKAGDSKKSETKKTDDTSKDNAEKAKPGLRI